MTELAPDIDTMLPPTPVAPVATSTLMIPADKITGRGGYLSGTGRRKSSVARVRVATGSGKISINGRELNDYLVNERDRKQIFGPLEVSNLGGKVDVHCRTAGGGLSSQAGAIVMGLARALRNLDPALDSALRHSGFLTRDSRMKERKKYGQRGARRRFQFSKR